MRDADIYTKLTDQIVAALEAGVQPWFKPWTGVEMSRPLRFNGEPYRGVNVIMLWMTAEVKGYNSPTWMTFNQAKDLGTADKPCSVRKGEKSATVVKPIYITKKNENTGEDERSFVNVKTYHVFNCDQIDGLPEKYQIKTEPKSQAARINDAEVFFGHLGMDLRHGGNRAFYSPSEDFVKIPNFEDFESAEAYYCTLGHESAHWTGAEKRLAREFGQKRWGDEGYAIEELVAELSSAYLGADLGIATTPRAENASYIANWLKVLKNDKRAIFTAVSYAERAVSYLHDLQPK